MSEHVCPWWVGYLLILPIRRWLQNPAAIVGPHIRPGMTVLEPGPGMGFFTMELARQVGPAGRVVAVDVQPRMIDKLKSRMAKVGLLDRLDARVPPAESMGIDDLRGQVDFTLAFFMVHEMPSASHFFKEAAAATKPGGTLLLSEPRGHVKEETFEEELRAAADAGFSLVDRPSVWRGQSALVRKE